jgi:hypothetical protein
MPWRLRFDHAMLSPDPLRRELQLFPEGGHWGFKTNQCRSSSSTTYLPERLMGFGLSKGDTLNLALADPAVKQAFAKSGFDTVRNTPEEAAAMLKNEYDVWDPVIRSPKLEPQ